MTKTKPAHRGKDRRNNVRKTAGFSAAIVRVNDRKFQNKWDHEVGFNIGLGGMGLKSERPLPAKANVTVIVLLPDEEQELMELDAKLTWLKEGTDAKKKLYYMGLEFTKLEPAALEQIQQFLDADP